MQLATRLASSLLLVALAALPAAGQKDQVWTEIKSPNFVVVGDGSEKQTRRVAEQFEEFRSAFQQLLPNVTVDLGKPLIILAVKNEKGLRALLPEFWERKGSSHPAGIFIPGQERLYVALRTDVTGDFPYSIIYHEYVHALVNLNLSRVPTWLNEGLAEFYAHTILGDKEAGIGRPDPNALNLLNREKLLPLPILFNVDHHSPYYNERNKTSIFYAQSWALVHYLMFEDIKDKKKRLATYLDTVNSGVEPTEAAKQAFGDLKQLDKTLNDYVRQSRYHYLPLKTAGDVDEKQFPMRVLSPAESAALRGNFHAHRRRKAEATALLEEALRLDPNNALANESMGILHLYGGEMDQAMEWFDKAARLDSSSYLAQYFAGMLAVQRGLAAEHTAEAEARLLRAIELNPKFAPAHSTLANLYQFRDETLEKSYQHAKRAAELEPGVLAHRLNFANVLMRMKRMDDALGIARQALAAATSEQDKVMFQRFIQSAEQYKASLAEYERLKREGTVETEAEQPMVDGVGISGPRPALRRRSGQAAAIPMEPEKPAVAERQLKATGKQATAVGRVTGTVCGHKAMSLTLDQGGKPLAVYSSSFYELDFMAYQGWEPPKNFQPCAHLQGLRVKVTYKVADDAEYAGEITVVEILKP